MGLGVFPDPLAAPDQIVVGYVHAAQLQVEIRPPQPAQLAAARTGNGHQPKVSREFRMYVLRDGNDLRYLAGGQGDGWLAPVLGQLRRRCGLRVTHSHRTAVTKAPDKMAWICRTVPADIGLQRCG